MESLMNPWPWYIAGPLVALIMLALVALGKNFGFSSNFRTICAALGAGRSNAFFRFDWKAQRWNLLFLLGSVLGGYLASEFLSSREAPSIAAQTVSQLQLMGIHDAGERYYPAKIFDDWGWKNVAIMAIGGLLIGFGTRYAGGCTSGHAISGLSDLQLPSLIAVIGFFIGGLLMVHVLFPILF